MELVTALLKELFGKNQCGGKTIGVTMTMHSATHCSGILRLSDCGGNTTKIVFAPPLPTEEALLHARKYTGKGTFSHRS